MQTAGLVGFLGGVGVVAISLFGLSLIVRGLLANSSSTKAKTGRADVRGPSLPGATARSASGILSCAVVYKFFFERYRAGLYNLESTFVLTLVVLIGIVIVPALESAVALAALVLFLMDNSAAFGWIPIGAFLFLFLLYAFARWILGR